MYILPPAEGAGQFRRGANRLPSGCASRKTSQESWATFSNLRLTLTYSRRAKNWSAAWSLQRDRRSMNRKILELPGRSGPRTWVDSMTMGLDLQVQDRHGQRIDNGVDDDSWPDRVRPLIEIRE